MSTVTDHPATQSLSLVEDMLWARCHWFVRRYGGTLEDAKSEANEAFIIAVVNWNENRKMAFSSYVFQVVTHRLLEHARTFARYCSRNTHWSECDTINQPVVKLTFEERLSELSEGAQTLFYWLDAYSEDILVGRQSPPHKQQQRIIKFFVDRGWDYDDVVSYLCELESLVHP